jgi:FkbM family methyltransferase
MDAVCAPPRGPVSSHGRWYEDDHYVSGLPLLYRMFAKYCSRRVVPTTGYIPYEYRLFRAIGRTSQWLGLPTETVTVAGDLKVAVDLLDPRAKRVHDEIADGSIEEPLGRLLNAGDTFLDVGANHGSYALIAARLVGPAGRVVAFEPQRRLVRMLLRSANANDLRNITAFVCGLSNVRRRATLNVPTRAPGSASLYPAYVRGAEQTAVDVTLERLDDLESSIPASGRTVVKMDIEGGERDCLLGGERFFTQRRPDLIVEINQDSAAAAGYTVDDLLALLRSYGYTRFADLDAFVRSGVATSAPDLSRPLNLLALTEPTSA